MTSEENKDSMNFEEVDLNEGDDDLMEEVENIPKRKALGGKKQTKKKKSKKKKSKVTSIKEEINERKEDNESNDEKKEEIKEEIKDEDNDDEIEKEERKPRKKLAKEKKKKSKKTKIIKEETVEEEKKEDIEQVEIIKEEIIKEEEKKEEEIIEIIVNEIKEAYIEIPKEQEYTIYQKEKKEEIKEIEEDKKEEIKEESKEEIIKEEIIKEEIIKEEIEEEKKEEIKEEEIKEEIIKEEIEEDKKEIKEEEIEIKPRKKVNKEKKKKSKKTKIIKEENQEEEKEIIIEKGEEEKEIKKKKKTKKKSKKGIQILPNIEQDENTYLIYSSGEDCNMDGLRRAKKKPASLSTMYGTKKLTSEELMEDDHFCGMSFNGDETRSFFAIYDGYAGIDVAKESRRLTPQILTEELTTSITCENSHTFLQQVFEKIDNHLNIDKFMDLGCTCTLLHLWHENGKKYIQSGNVGDSTCFVKKKEQSTIITLSEDHKVTSPIEQQRFKEMGIQMVEGQKRINGVSISRCLGNHFVKQLNVGMIGTPYISDIIELESGDEIIVCSDGIWDVISPEEAFTLMGSHDIRTFPKELMNISMNNVECKDNITVIAIRMK